MLQCGLNYSTMPHFNPEHPYRVLLYYQYVDIADPEQFRKEHKALCKELNLVGRILVGAEGINGTVSGRTEDTDAYKHAMHADPRFSSMQFKEDSSDFIPFRKLKIKTRDEIVTLEAENATPERGGAHLSPREWHELAQRDDVVILDARNEYEWVIGRFKNAMLPNIELFKEFPQWVEQHKDELKDKKVLMYCTGGIRCERASTVVKDITGNEEVYQLSGGIHSYGQEIPDGLWEGSMYVFDDRTKVQINDDAHHEIISTCNFCDAKTDEYYNCCNAECNQRILLCNTCVEKANQACSEECSQKHRAGIVRTWDIKKRVAV